MDVRGVEKKISPTNEVKVIRIGWIIHTDSEDTKNDGRRSLWRKRVNQILNTQNTIKL